MLFSRESACIQPLRALVEAQTHKALVLWALDCAAPCLEAFEANQPARAAPGGFLMDGTRPNKETLLRQKAQNK